MKESKVKISQAFANDKCGPNNSKKMPFYHCTTNLLV